MRLLLACAGDPMPSGKNVRKTDEAMRLTEQNRCPFCKARITDETCPCWNKEND